MTTTTTKKKDRQTDRQDRKTKQKYKQDNASKTIFSFAKDDVVTYIQYVTHDVICGYLFIFCFVWECVCVGGGGRGEGVGGSSTHGYHIKF